jgi:hypothetical protein
MHNTVDKKKNKTIDKTNKTIDKTNKKTAKKKNKTYKQKSLDIYGRKTQKNKKGLFY